MMHQELSTIPITKPTLTGRIPTPYATNTKRFLDRELLCAIIESNMITYGLDH